MGNPQINYVYTAAGLNTNRYYLHVVTTMDQANYEADHQALVEVLENGRVSVELLIHTVDSIAPLNQDTPVVHVVYVGEYPTTESPEIEISLFVEKNEEPKSKLGETIVITTEAVEDLKPIEMKKN